MQQGDKGQQNQQRQQRKQRVEPKCVIEDARPDLSAKVGVAIRTSSRRSDGKPSGHEQNRPCKHLGHVPAFPGSLSIRVADRGFRGANETVCRAKYVPFELNELDVYSGSHGSGAFLNSKLKSAFCPHGAASSGTFNVDAASRRISYGGLNAARCRIYENAYHYRMAEMIDKSGGRRVI